MPTRAERPGLDNSGGSGITLSAVVRLGWVLLLWVSADFANPMIPGAVRLDPDESIDAVARHSAGHIPLPSPAVARHPDRPECPVGVGIVEPESRRPILPGRRWSLPLRALRHPPDSLTAAGPTEDH
jgi:hypothetical protein